VAGGTTSLTIGLTDGAYPTASSVAGATALVLGGWSLIDRLRGNQTSPATTSGRRWTASPSTMTTVTGRTRPALRATVQF
jgi:hypothetical protein